MGAVISSAGFWIMVEKDKEVRDALDVFFDPSILMCIAGCIIFCLAFFGCLGALRENICLLKTVRVGWGSPAGEGGGGAPGGGGARGLQVGHKGAFYRHPQKYNVCQMKA